MACSRKQEVVAAHRMPVHLGVKKDDLDGIKKIIAMWFILVEDVY